jgi:hypothetical protein
MAGKTTNVLKASPQIDQGIDAKAIVGVLVARLSDAKED